MNNLTQPETNIEYKDVLLKQCLERITMNLSRIQSYIDNKLISIVYDEMFKCPRFVVNPSRKMDMRRDFIKFLKGIKFYNDSNNDSIKAKNKVTVEIEFIPVTQEMMVITPYVGKSFPNDTDFYDEIDSIPNVHLL